MKERVFPVRGARPSLPGKPCKGAIRAFTNACPAGNPPAEAVDGTPMQLKKMGKSKRTISLVSRRRRGPLIFPAKGIPRFSGSGGDSWVTDVESQLDTRLIPSIPEEHAGIGQRYVDHLLCPYPINGELQVSSQQQQRWKLVPPTHPYQQIR